MHALIVLAIIVLYVPFAIWSARDYEKKCRRAREREEGFRYELQYELTRQENEKKWAKAGGSKY